MLSDRGLSLLPSFITEKTEAQTSCNLSRAKLFQCSSPALLHCFQRAKVGYWWWLWEEMGKGYGGKPWRSLSPRTCTCTIPSKGNPATDQSTVNESQGRAGCEQPQGVAKPRGGPWPHSQHLCSLPESAHVSSLITKLDPQAKLSCVFWAQKRGKRLGWLQSCSARGGHLWEDSVSQL